MIKPRFGVLCRAPGPPWISGLDLEKPNRDEIGVFLGSGIHGLHTMEEQHTVLMAKGYASAALLL